MSIHDSIKAHLGTSLFLLPPLMRGSASIRTLFVSSEVRDSVEPPWSEDRDGLRLSTFRGTLDAFTQGDWLMVADDPFMKPSYAYMARVHPVGDDLFDIRSIDPNPGIRCLGGFAGKDTFISLTWDYRENLIDRKNWKFEIARCKAEWQKIFGSCPPLNGASLHDYLSGNFTAV